MSTQIESKAEVSGSNNEWAKPIWRSIWNLSNWPRIKITMWKIVNDILPTRCNIRKKGVDSTRYVSCAGLRKKPQSMCFGFAKSQRQVWTHFLPNLLGLFSGSRDQLEPMDCWGRMIRSLNKQEINSAAKIMWSMWNTRNQSLQKGIKPEFSQIHRTISNLLDELEGSEGTNLKNRSMES